MILKRKNVRRSTDSLTEIERLKAEGFAPIKDRAALPPEAEVEVEPQEKPDFKKMHKPQLVFLADKAGIENAANLTKAELIEALEG